MYIFSTRFECRHVTELQERVSKIKSETRQKLAELEKKLEDKKKEETYSRIELLGS